MSGTIPSVNRAVERYEAGRAGYLKKWRRTALGLAALTSVLCLFSLQLGLNLTVAFVIVLIALKVTYVRRLTPLYKNEVIAALIPDVCAEGIYTPQNGIDRQVFVKSHLFDHTLERYHTEDLVTGRIGATGFCFAEVTAKRKQTSTDSKGNVRTTYPTFFEGFLFVADFQKEFAGQTVLLPVRRGSKYRQKQRVRLENPDFDKLFRVYTTDIVEAHYILTPSLMERLTILTPKLSRRMRVSFTGSQIIIAVPDSRDHYEASLWKPASKCLNRDTDALRKLAGIVEELNMNTRIWSKI